MTVPIKIIKRSVRHCKNEESRFAMMELNAIIDQNPDWPWIAYIFRGKVHEQMQRYLFAINDYVQALKQPNYLSARNQKRLLDSIVSCATALQQAQTLQVKSKLQPFLYTPPQSPPPPESFSARQHPDTKRPIIRSSDAQTILERIDEIVRSMEGPAALGSGAGSGAGAAAPRPVGKIAQIGKFLLDQRDVEKIRALVCDEPVTASNVRRLTVQAAKDLDKLLYKISQQPLVVGACVIGRDGFMLGSTLPEDDNAALGIRSLAFYLNASMMTEKIGHEEVRQSLVLSTQGYIIILDFSGGILITVTNEQDSSKAVKLMKKIKKLSEKCNYAIPPAPDTTEKVPPVC